MADKEIKVEKKQEITEHKYSVSDYHKAWEDLRRAILLSCMNDDGSMMSYEINGTARAIPLAVYALVMIRAHDAVSPEELMSL